VEVVAGGHHIHAVLEGNAVHQVPLGETAARAWRPPRHVLDHRNGRAYLVGDPRDHQPRTPGRRKGLALRLRFDGIVEDAEIEVEAGRVVAVVEQHVPQRERVLAARHGHQHTLPAGEHPVTADRLAHLVAEEVEKIGRAEGRVVASQLERCGRAALAALHCNELRELGSDRGWPASDGSWLRSTASSTASDGSWLRSTASPTASDGSRLRSTASSTASDGSW